jgi:hypothetical protein
VELYFPSSEYDLQTISAVLYGIASAAAMVLITMFACFPETKIPVVSNLFAKVNQLEKNNIRTLSTKVGVSPRNFIVVFVCVSGVVTNVNIAHTHRRTPMTTGCPTSLFRRAPTRRTNKRGATVCYAVA